MRTYSYRAVIEPGESPDVQVVSFPDVPEAITDGTDRADAQRQAADALGLALLAYLRQGRPLPPAAATEGEPVTVSAEVAAKLAVLEAFTAAGIPKTELGRRIGRDEREVRRILDPMHPTKLPMLVQALEALGRRLVVGVEDMPDAA
jgi:antitoxin HicB